MSVRIGREIFLDLVFMQKNLHAGTRVGDVVITLVPEFPSLKKVPVISNFFKFENLDESISV